MKNMLEQPSNIWDYDKDVYNRLSPEDLWNSLMSEAERKFINGMIRYHKPRKILELGVSKGAGSIVILNAISDMPESELVSIDIANDEHIGVDSLNKYPESKQWSLYTDTEPSEIISKLAENSNFDFVIIDTAHYHPVETLNFLTVLPYLTENAIVIVQDIALVPMTMNMRKSNAIPYVPLHRFPDIAIAAKLLFDVVAADKITLPISIYDDSDIEKWNIVYSNIGAFQVNSDIFRYLDNLFSILEFPWAWVPTKIEYVASFLQKHYEEKHYASFQQSYKNNFLLCNNQHIYYQLSDIGIDFGKFDTIVFYGCGSLLKSFMGLESFPRLPNEIWDMNADLINQKSDHIALLKNIPIKKPNFDILNKSKVAVIVTISRVNYKREVRQLLKHHGFENVFDFTDFLC